ncbi:hypothetical protein LCGC14_2450020 [marine sediment metagenome]|uniref:Uncharacterized protein n=1 Tax=marine sediment metagenome TaxID=412755 RepID=A0A0F9BGF9_9ZZZZ
MTLRDAMKNCLCLSGTVPMDIRPLSHLDKLAKHLNDKGEMTVGLTGCSSIDNVDGYCGSGGCPILKRAQS